MSQNMWKIIGVIELALFIALAAFAAVSGGCSTQVETAMGTSMPMKCHWTFVAVPFVAGTGAVAALLALLSKQAGARRACSAIAAVAACAAMTLATPWGIGLCASPDMHCHATAHVVWAIGAIAVAGAIVQVAKARTR